MSEQLVNPILLDARTPEEVWDQFRQEMLSASMVGFDLETEDSNRHEGLKQYLKIDDEGNKKSERVVFDTNRTTICGMSFYADGSQNAYYANLGHADVENRIAFEKVKPVLDAMIEKGTMILAHNAPFEIMMMKKCLGYDLRNVFCTLQLCVSAYGPDEYDVRKFYERDLGGMKALIPEVIKHFSRPIGDELTEDQEQLIYKVTGKQSAASYSYNTYVDEMAWGYGLKKAVKSWFGYEMKTYEETLGDFAHMGLLTGDQVVSYGTDDAYWCVRLFHRVYQHILETNPAVFQTYIEQENPMIYIYAKIWGTGLRVNKEAIQERREFERQLFAQKLREMKAAIRACLPFPAEPDEKLLKLESWYQKNWAKYRANLEAWATSEDSPDPYQQCIQVRSPISNVWMTEVEGRAPKGINLTHYMVARTIYHDLLGLSPVVIDGKVRSDADARGRMIKQAEKLGHENALTILGLMHELSSIDQRMKMYITPYLLLVDPDTSRMYPEISSKLATRRMATSNPNTLALAKNSESSFIRGFFLPDDDDSLIVSLDWSSVELVLIGEESGDPEFKRCFGQIPYEDLHAGAAADTLGIPEDLFKSLKTLPDDVEVPIPLVTPDGRKLPPRAFYKEMRTQAGKGSNFEYWYSGSLSTVGKYMNWSSDQMWEAVERYRRRFAVAEQWRVNTIDQVRVRGYVELKDHHRRVRFEATDAWRRAFIRKWERYGEPAVRFAELVARKIQTRAYNQSVNAKIQGTGATLAKRSILALERIFSENDFWKDCRFMLPIHDELVFSIPKSKVVPFIKVAKQVMRNHPDIVRNLVLHSTASVGRTFQPWHPEKAPYGQIELDEAPKLSVIPEEFEGKSLPDDQIEKVVEYLSAA